MIKKRSKMETKRHRALVLTLLSALLVVGCRKGPGAADSAPGTITVNIDKDLKYVPKGHPMGLSVAQSSAVGLAADPYEQLVKEPPYGSGPVRYGYIQLGNSDDVRISFAVTDSGDDKWIIYVDTNNNEDLTDDGPPLANAGSGKLAALIALSVDVVSASGEKIVRPYQLWLWLNKSDSPRFYTRCHYRAQISIGRQQYTAVAYEFDNHDALYRESGLWIDLNGDGKLSKEQEHFSDGATIDVEGEQYVLELSYP